MCNHKWFCDIKNGRMVCTVCGCWHLMTKEETAAYTRGTVDGRNEAKKQFAEAAGKLLEEVDA